MFSKNTIGSSHRLPRPIPSENIFQDGLLTRLQVQKIARIARELGVEPATPDEARQTLGLKGLEEVDF